MDRETIRGYARAVRVVGDALEGRVPEDTVSELFEVCCDCPKTGLAEMIRLASSCHAMDAHVRSALADALESVEDGVAESLDVNEREDFILDWARAQSSGVDTISVTRAAEELGMTPQGIRKLIAPDPDDVPPGRLRAYKSGGRWRIDAESFEELREWRDRRQAARDESERAVAEEMARDGLPDILGEAI